MLQILSTRGYIVQPSLINEEALDVESTNAMDSCHYQFIQIGHSINPIHLLHQLPEAEVICVLCAIYVTFTFLEMKFI